MYMSLGALGQGSRPRAFPVEVLFDSEAAGPADEDEMINPEPVIFEEPKEGDRGYPVGPTSPFEQFPDFEPTTERQRVVEARKEFCEERSDTCMVPLDKLRELNAMAKKACINFEEICEAPNGIEISEKEL